MEDWQTVQKKQLCVDTQQQEGRRSWAGSSPRGWATPVRRLDHKCAYVSRKRGFLSLHLLLQMETSQSATLLETASAGQVWRPKQRSGWAAAPPWDTQCSSGLSHTHTRRKTSSLQMIWIDTIYFSLKRKLFELMWDWMFVFRVKLCPTATSTRWASPPQVKPFCDQQVVSCHFLWISIAPYLTS